MLVNVPTLGRHEKLVRLMKDANRGNERFDIYLKTSKLRGTIPDVTIVHPSKTLDLSFG